MPPDPSRSPWADVLILWIPALALLALSLLPLPLPGWAREVWITLPSAWLLFSPWVLARIRRRDPEAWVLGEGSPLPSVKVGLMVALAIFPPYVLLFQGWSVLVERRPMHWDISRLADFPTDVQGMPGGISRGDEALWVFGESGRLTVWNRTSRDLEVRIPGCREAPEGLRWKGERMARGPSPGTAAGARIPPDTGIRCRIDAGPSFLEVPPGTPMRLGEQGRAVVAGSPLDVGRSFRWIWVLAWTHLLGVALPEEVFYRGFVQRRLADTFRRRLRVLGADLGPEVFLASALFALSHLVLIPAPFRLAVFFPGLLFGWIRARTDSTAGSIVVHALSNVLLAVLVRFQGP